MLAIGVAPGEGATRQNILASSSEVGHLKYSENCIFGIYSTLKTVF